jgi:hypothetical protein
MLATLAQMLGVPWWALPVGWALVAGAGVALVLVAVMCAPTLPVARLGKQRARYARRGAVALILATTVAVLVRSYGPIGENAARRVKAGMTMQEVEALLGRPHQMGPAQYGGRLWYYYYDWTFMAYFGIWFDESGRVRTTFLG